MLAVSDPPGGWKGVGEDTTQLHWMEQQQEKSTKSCRMDEQVKESLLAKQ